MRKKCFIFGAGEYGELSLGKDGVKNALVIAADGGYGYTSAHEIEPDIIIGDFDSLGYIPDGKNVVKMPAEKDDTDMIAAIRKALEYGCSEIIIYGALGGRLDHTVANLQSLSFIASHGAQGYILSDREALTVIRGGTLLFSERFSGTVSVFSIGDRCTGVNLRGLKYPLSDAVITEDYPIGVSNEFTGDKAAVSLESGNMLVMWTNIGELPEYITERQPE